MKPLASALSVAALFLLAFTGVAAAQGAVAPDEGGLLFEMLRSAWSAASGGQWWLAGALGVVFAVAALRRYAPGKIGAFVNSAFGIRLAVLVTSFAGAVAASLSGATPQPMSLALAWSAVQVAVLAAGGYAMVVGLVIEPIMATAWYKERAPAWLKSVFELVVWAFLKPSPAIARAEAEGDKAVAAAPPTGTDGVVGPAKGI